MTQEIFYAKLLTLILALLTPIYFIILVFIIPEIGNVVVPLPIPETAIKILTALVISFPWIFLIYELRNILPEAFIELKNTTSLIPLKWKIFYGVNALIVATFFIIPLVTPLFTIVMCFIIAGRIVSHLIDIEKHGKLIWILWSIFSTILLLTLGYFIAILVFSNMVGIVFSLIVVWYQHIEIIAALSIWVANSLAYGSLIEIIFLYKIHKEIDIIGMKTTDVPYHAIRIFELCFFLTLAVIWLYFSELRDVIFFYINNIALAIVIMVFVFGTVSGMKKKKMQTSFIGILVAAVFVSIYIYQQLNLIAITIILIISSFMFYILFAYSILKIRKTKLYSYQ
ncbi:MAG: hypothetical protein ABGF52_03295 [Candidatus Asgardarchaeum sp.]